MNKLSYLFYRSLLLTKVLLSHSAYRSNFADSLKNLTGASQVEIFNLKIQ